MKTAFIISMYDEHDLVLASIKAIRSVFPHAVFVVSHSDDGTCTPALAEIKLLAASYDLLPDLSKGLSRFEYPAASICRNMSRGFAAVARYAPDADLFVAFTGDTLVRDATTFHRLYERMQRYDWAAMVAQAMGQHFHAPSDNPEAGIGGNRFQSWNTTDFVPALFLVNGPFARRTHVFHEVPITNRYTSEQCLGDALSFAVGGQESFRAAVGLLNWEDPLNCYRHNDGILYHAKHHAPAGRHI